jgi:hypothetical protein
MTGRFRRGRLGRKLALLAGGLALAASVPLIGVAVAQPSGPEALDPVRNAPLLCELPGGVPGTALATRSANNIEHAAWICDAVGTDVEFQSRRDAKGKTHDYAFVGTMGGGMRIYDITNPRRPVFAGGFLDAGWQNDVQVRGNIAFTSFDGVAGEPSSASTCLKTKFAGANDQGVDIFRLVYDPAAAALEVPLVGDPVPHFEVGNPTCIAVPSGGAHNSTINPTGRWLAVSNCCSDWAVDVVDMRPATTGANRVDLRPDPVPPPVHRYRLIDASRRDATRCEGRAQPPGPVTCIVMTGLAAEGVKAPAGTWRPHDLHFSRDGNRMFVAAINGTFIVDVSRLPGGASCTPNPHPAGAVCEPVRVPVLAYIPNVTGQEASTSEKIEISHQADVTPDEKILVVSDEKGGGTSNTDCNSQPNNQASGRLGGLHFYALAELPGVPRSKGASISNPRKIGFYVYPNPAVGPDPAQDVLDAFNARQALNGLPRLERGCTVHVFRIGGNGTASPGPAAPGFDGVSRLPSRQLVTGWYGAGTWHVDFSRPPSNTDGIAEDSRTTWGNTLGWNIMPGADTWSSKEYKGTIATGDMLRGFDTFTFEQRPPRDSDGDGDDDVDDDGDGDEDDDGDGRDDDDDGDLDDSDENRIKGLLGW